MLQDLIGSAFFKTDFAYACALDNAPGGDALVAQKPYFLCFWAAARIGRWFAYNDIAGSGLLDFFVLREVFGQYFVLF